MNVLWENVYTDTMQFMMELYRIRTRPRRTVWLIVYSFLTLFGLLLVLVCGSVASWAVFLIEAAYLIWFLLMPWFFARKYIKTTRDYHNGVIPQTRTLFLEDRILSEFGESHSTVHYDKISKIYVGKDIILLYTGKIGHLALNPQGFTTGTFREFLAFLRAKCPQLNLPARQW